ncbi:hypothetical protein B5F40_08795 [Gordonibacter sp. An230]|uniref:dihydrofolate reductase family protein n=1 Tax=Gordonibacter sp. An230 TaxID=1965592 RepID=UPI000B395471|nr:dihydrofolate reductase family protein [Gordonibacter sp. An230]OUO89922.1 hypothetical protein B5F40_08795 [Gordonibacter sp. An230]
MERPFITCYMMNSLDGRIIGNYFETDRGREFIVLYERIHDRIGAPAFMNGRTTFEDWPWQLEPGNRLDLPADAPRIEREDCIFDTGAERYAIAIDGSGKLAWRGNAMIHGASDLYSNRCGDHIVTVLTRRVSDAYLAFLRDRRVSYIFGGDDALDLALVVGKLRSLLGIEHLLLEGGGRLNGSFVRAGLVDEYKVLLMATVDGGSGEFPTKTSFDVAPGQGGMVPVDFAVGDVERVDDRGLLLTFTRA